MRGRGCSSETECWSCSRTWWTSRWWWRGKTAARRATVCWRRSGSTGWEKLSESDEAAEFRERHAGYYLALAEEAEPELKGERQVAWLERLEREHDNLRVVDAMVAGARRARRRPRGSVGRLWLFWGIRAHFAEGRRSMEQALTAEGSVAMPASARAQALFVAGMMANYQGDHLVGGTADRREPRVVQGSSRTSRGIAWALSNAGIAAIGQGQHQRAITLIEESVDLFLEVGEKWGAVHPVLFPGGGVARPGRSRAREAAGGARTGAVSGGGREARHLLGALYPGDPGAGRARPRAREGPVRRGAQALGGVGQRGRRRPLPGGASVRSRRRRAG